MKSKIYFNHLTVLRSYALTVFFMLSYGLIYCQISTNEKPVSLKTQIPALSINEQTHKALPSLDMNKIEQEDKEDEKNGIIPRFGYKHEVSYNLTNSGEWIELPTGDKLWRLRISCPEATSINLLYDHFWLPEGTKYFIYGNEYKDHLGAFTSKNNRGKKEDNRGFATGLIRSDHITLEYYVPNGVEDVGIISVSHVVHGYKLFGSLDRSDSALGDSKGNHTNINCPMGDDWQDEKNAVVMIIANGNRNCSGALVNTTANGNTNRHFILTADHCLPSGGINDLDSLPNWFFHWHYESPNCTVPDDEPEPPLIPTKGAKVVARAVHGDFALLELFYDPAEEWDVMPYYLGWDHSGEIQEGSAIIHHPRCGIKKIYVSPSDIVPQIEKQPRCEPPYSNYDFPTHWLGAGTGTVHLPENGSSGSPLLNFDKRLIGHCSGTRQPPDYPSYEASYGKFSWAWEGYRYLPNCDIDSTNRLKDWLDPLNTKQTTLDGRGGCQKTIRLDRTLSISRTYHAVQNIISKQKIESDSTIIYKAGTEIVLEEGFHAKPGSNFWASIEELDCNDTKSMSSFSPGDEENGTEDNHYLLSQNQIQHTINLFPNPNTGTFQLESNFPLSDIGNLKIVNLLGAPVYETQNLTSNTIQMPASAMGQYFVVIILKDGSVVTQKMMIVK